MATKITKKERKASIFINTPRIAKGDYIAIHGDYITVGRAANYEMMEAQSYTMQYKGRADACMIPAGKIIHLTDAQVVKLQTDGYLLPEHFGSFSEQGRATH